MGRRGRAVSGVFGHGVSKCRMDDEKISFKGGDIGYSDNEQGRER